jgi:hypothetical protein
MSQEYVGGSAGSYEPRSSGYTGQHEQEGTSEQARRYADATKTAVRNAYDKTSSAVQSGYHRTVEYSNQHPQTFSLVTFAAGFGAGALLGATALASRHTRTERMASPLIDAFAQIARTFVRG